MNETEDDRLGRLLAGVEELIADGRHLLLIYESHPAIQIKGSHVLEDAFNFVLASFVKQLKKDNGKSGLVIDENGDLSDKDSEGRLFVSSTKPTSPRGNYRPNLNDERNGKQKRRGKVQSSKIKSIRPSKGCGSSASFSCDICGKTFTRRIGLKEHRRTHTGEKPYRCDLCPASFTVSQNLRAHKAVHAGLKPFQCDQCGRSFPRKANLLIHERSHSKEKPFSCASCLKKFSQSSCLKRHQKIHTGEKPTYVCGDCGKTFSTKHYLTVHERLHSGHRPFRCFHEHCGLTFYQKRHLHAHQRRLHVLGEARVAIGEEAVEHSAPSKNLAATSINPPSIQ